MIRTVLASSWVPVIWWAVMLIVVEQKVEHQIRKHPDTREMSIVRPLMNRVSLKPVSIANYLPEWMRHDAFPPTHHMMVEQWKSSISHKEPNPIATPPSAIPIPTSVLTIRAYPKPPADNFDSNTLAIHCRTYAPISNAESARVIVHGVVIEDVVSATGRILIMAGSKVVGSALIDPENCRLKSDFNHWSIFIDETEMKVQALLLDRIGGLAGIQGKEIPGENSYEQRAAAERDGRYVFFAEASPFWLVIKGDISLRDLKSEQLTQKSLIEYYR